MLQLWEKFYMKNCAICGLKKYWIDGIIKIPLVLVYKVAQNERPIKGRPVLIHYSRKTVIIDGINPHPQLQFVSFVH